MTTAGNQGPLGKWSKRDKASRRESRCPLDFLSGFPGLLLQNLNTLFAILVSTMTTAENQEAFGKWNKQYSGDRRGEQGVVGKSDIVRISDLLDYLVSFVRGLVSLDPKLVLAELISLHLSSSFIYDSPDPFLDEDLKRSQLPKQLI